MIDSHSMVCIMGLSKQEGHMTETDNLILQSKLSQLEQSLQILQTFNDIHIVRSYVAETALAFLASEGKLDLDAIERVMLDELGERQGTRVRAAVSSLRERVAAPRTPQKD